MKRLAFSVAAAAAAFAATWVFSACEKHSADNLPEHYLHKGGQHVEAGAEHETAPAHGEKEKAPAGEHKG